MKHFLEIDDYKPLCNVLRKVVSEDGKLPSNSETEKKYSDFFVSNGMELKRAKFLAPRMILHWNITDDTIENKLWALQRGFTANRIKLYGLTEENYRFYLSDVDYFMMHPLNNFFAFWINDKVTLKYMFQKPICINI